MAEAIVKAARDERPEVYVTWFDRAAVTLKGISPRFIDWGMRRFYLRRRAHSPRDRL